MDDAQALAAGALFVAAYVAAVVWGVRRGKRRRGHPREDPAPSRPEAAPHDAVARRIQAPRPPAIPPEPASFRARTPGFPARPPPSPARTTASGRMSTAQWLAGRRFRTERGEMVRSEVEVAIANHLHRRGFRYEYEAEVCGFRPDFFLREHRIVIEFWGGRDEAYAARRRRKTRAYLSAGYGLVSLSAGKGIPVERDLDRQLYHRLRGD